jgi:hypothetical protein
MKFEFETKDDDRKPVAYLAYSHIWFPEDEDEGFVCLCSDVAAVSKVFSTATKTLKDLSGAKDFKKFYPGDKLTITL